MSKKAKRIGALSLAILIVALIILSGFNLNMDAAFLFGQRPVDAPAEAPDVPLETETNNLTTS